MHLYVAGLYASNFQLTGKLFAQCTPNTKLLRAEVEHKLESYHYIKKGRMVENIRRDGIRVFLDSGAFSAFSLGVKVDIGAYADYVKANQDIILMASVLDAIGDPVGTFHNQKELERRGVAVLPCFHYGEPFDLCEYYVNNYEYITIGGMVPIANNILEFWLDELWDRILTDKDGYSRVKVHGFGMTTLRLMIKYPWYSVDSSTWVQRAANGMITIPEFGNLPIDISARSPRRKQHNQHFNTFPDLTQERITERVEYYGQTVEELQHDYRARWALNAFAYDQLGRRLGEDHWRKPFHAVQPGLFS